jgi:hypothetical protein
MDQMTINHAYRIVMSYDKLSNREVQEALVKEVYPIRLGGKLIKNCSNQHIWGISHSMLKRARKMVSDYWAEVDKELDITHFSHYYLHLYEIFNIPEDQREHTNPEDLEAQLLN